MREEILKEFDEKFYFGNLTVGTIQSISGDQINEIKQFISQAITKTEKRVREETIREVVKSIISRRGCRSHEPENCNICEGRQEAIDILNKLKK